MKPVLWSYPLEQMMKDDQNGNIKIYENDNAIGTREQEEEEEDNVGLLGEHEGAISPSGNGKYSSIQNDASNGIILGKMDSSKTGNPFIETGDHLLDSWLSNNQAIQTDESVTLLNSGVGFSSNPFVEDGSQEGTYFFEESVKHKSHNPFLDSFDSIDNGVEFQSDHDQVGYHESTREIGSGRTSPVNKLSYHSKVDRSTITFNFNSNSKAESPHTDTNHHSFSMSNSCNTSLRSDSRSTSTQSFAFPVLNAEWNSSPIRMAKGNKSFLRKHKCWRNGLLCCRF